MEFSFEECAKPLPDEVERIARIELHAPRECAGPATEIGVACAGDDVRLTVDDPLTGKRVERTVSLAAVAELGRARLLALAVAELVRSSWMELEFRKTPALPVAAPVDVPVALKERARAIAVASDRPTWRGDASVEALIVPSVGRPILGLSLAAQHDVAPSIFVEGAASAWDGVTERATGAIAVRQIALDPAIGWRVSILDLSLGARVGWVELSGTPVGAGFRGDTTSGVVFGPQAVLSLGVAAPLRLWLRSGWLIHGERGVVAGDSDVVVGGVYVAVGLGLRFGR